MRNTDDLKLKYKHDKGTVGKIARLFIWRLMALAPRNKTTKAWLEDLFHIDTRYILNYKSVKSFSMVGAKWDTPAIKYQGYGTRHISLDTYFTVRVDTDLPDHVDVEWNGGIGNKDNVHTLTHEEWMGVRRYLELLPEQVEPSIWTQPQPF